MSDDVLVFQEPSLLQIQEEITGDFILFNITELADPVAVPTPGDILVFNEASATDVQIQYSSGAVFVLTSGGPPGLPGLDGSDGAPGPTGESAYDIAVANGFVGTEADWLASLEGAPGDSPYYAEFAFATPSTTWSIAHGQGTYGLMIECFDNSGAQLIGATSYPDANTIVVEWYYPQSGYARVFN